MPNLTFTVSNFEIIPLYWCLLLAFIISSFSIWRRLIKRDYREQDIFNISLLMLLSGVVFGGLANYLTGDWLFGSLFGAVLIFTQRLKVLKYDVWEGLDSLCKPWLYFLFLVGIGKYLSFNTFKDLGYCLVALIGTADYFYFQKRYRTLSWYKSGKMGFLFSSVIFSTSLGLLGLDFWQKNGLYLTELFWTISMMFGLTLIFKRAEINKK